jgi:hypothetical protein
LRRSIAVETATVLTVWFIGAAVFFRSQWTSGFRNVIGNDGDTRLLVYLLEHWFKVFQGDADWRDPAFFYPQKNVLGWSDGLVFYQVFYTPLRSLGVEPFLAAQLSVILLSLVGYAALVCFVRLAFGAPTVVASIGALAFVFSNANWLHSGWFQLLAVWLIPVILLLGLVAWRLTPSRPNVALLLGAAEGALIGVSFYTGYYVSWFSALAGGVVLVLFVVVGGRALLFRLLAALRARWRLLASTTVGFALGIVPFLLTYLPARHEIVHESYQTVIALAARPSDLVNVGQGNVMWSRVVPRLFTSVDPSRFEDDYAVTPLVLVAAVVFAGFAFRLVSRMEADRRSPPTTTPAVLTASALVLSVLPVKTRFGSFWAVVWHIPGAYAIRAIDRIGIVTGLVAALALIAGAGEVYERAPARRRRSVQVSVVAVLCLLAVEQLNTTDESGINRASEQALLASVRQPPSTCRAFYVVDTRDPPPPFPLDQTEAMVISQKVSLPTINGYTGYQPRGWALANPADESYGAAVSSWIRAHRLQDGMCRLDLATMTWSPERG